MTMNSNKNYRHIVLETVNKKYRKRLLVDKLVTIFTIVCVIAAIVPLASILLEVIKNGISAISFEFLTQTQGSIGSGSGGIAPAIQGTIIVVGLAAAIATPVGVLTGIYLSEFAKEGTFSNAVRFFNDVLTGLPSIVVGHRRICCYSFINRFLFGIGRSTISFYNYDANSSARHRRNIEGGSIFVARSRSFSRTFQG